MNYCDASFSWSTTPNVKQYDISYHVTDENGAMDWAGLTPYNHANSTCLTITCQPDSDPGPCSAVLTCRQSTGMLISGLQVVSESRTLELFDQTRGYLMTVKGSLLDAQAQDRGENSPKLFRCQCVLEEPVRQLTFKFLSLGGCQSFTLHRLALALMRGGPSASISGQSGIQMDRLRRHVEELGDKVPDRAHTLLDAMEQYKKNQSAAIEGVQTMVSDSSLPPDKQALFSALLSMSGKASMAAPASQSSSSPGQPPPAAATLLSQLGAGSGGQSKDALGFMRAICSQVTKMRSPPPPERANGSVDVTSSLETFLEQKLQEAESRVLSQMDARIRDMEARLSAKLDAVVALLQNLNGGKVPSSQSSPDSGSQSLPDFGVTRNGMEHLEDVPPSLQSEQVLQGTEDSVTRSGQEDRSPEVDLNNSHSGGQQSVAMETTAVAAGT